MRSPQRPQISTPESSAVPARGRTDPAGPVRLQLRQVALILIPGDVGRHPIGQDDGGVVQMGRSPPGPGTAGLLPAPVDRAQAVDVGAGIDRVGEQVLQRGPAGPAPFQLALVWAAEHAHRQADVVPGEVAHDLADRPPALEQVEHQPDRRLRLLVGIEDDLAGGTAHIAHRHVPAEFAPRRLGPPALEHARLDDMQLCFRAFRQREAVHRPLEPEQQTIIVVRRIIHAIGIGDQRIKQGTDLKKLVPIPARPRQA